MVTLVKIMVAIIKLQIFVFKIFLSQDELAELEAVLESLLQKQEEAE